MTVAFPLCAILVGSTFFAPVGAKEGSRFSSINISPSQIQLGALVYGDSNSSPLHRQVLVSGLPIGTMVVDVDCTHARGVRILSETQNKSGTSINLEIDENQLCACEPFGAYVQRQIRFQTDSQVVPQFVIPIVGWLDVNKTPRNYTQFVFEGATRWQGWWATPNEGGAVLSIVALAATGVLGLLRRRFRVSRDRIVAGSIGVVLFLLCLSLVYLGLTYSRGSWLALILGYFAMVACSPALRPIALLGLAIFVGVLVFLPQGVQRIESYAIVHQDLSISNRLKLWEGALQMMAEHPQTGVGSNNFAPNFERDYQEFDHTAKTSTAVSDYMTLGSEHGLFVLGILLGSMSALLVLAFRASVKEDETVIVVLTAILIDLLVGSCFSTLWVLAEYRWTFVTVVLALSGYLGYKQTREQGYIECYRNFLREFSVHIFASVTALSLISFCSLILLPTEISSLEIRSQNRVHSTYTSVQPRWKQPRGIIVYFGDFGHPETFFHSTVRPLAALGWKVVPVSALSEPAAIHDLVNSLHQGWPGLNIFVAGESSGACTAWALACQESSSLISAGGGLNFLSMDMDRTDAKSKPTQPFLVYQSLYSNGTSSDPAICARDQVAFKDFPLTVVLSQDGLSHFSAGWMKFLQTLSAFFINETHRANR